MDIRDTDADSAMTYADYRQFREEKDVRTVNELTKQGWDVLEIKSMHKDDISWSIRGGAPMRKTELLYILGR